MADSGEAVLIADLSVVTVAAGGDPVGGALDALTFGYPGPWAGRGRGDVSIRTIVRFPVVWYACRA